LAICLYNVAEINKRLGDQLRYTKFNNESLSLLGMGIMRMPQEGEGWDNPIIYDQSEEIIDYCMAQGINYYDTATIYYKGGSETFLGGALSKYPRDSFYVADKYNLEAEPDFRLQFQEQLERLKMDRIDFYLLHGISDGNVSEYLSNGCIEYFLEEKKNGRIKYLGFSFHGTPDSLRQIIPRHQWDFAMIQLNYYDWYHGCAKEQYELLAKNDIPIMVMEPVYGGKLAELTEEAKAILLEAEPNKSIASWALRFVMALPGVSVVLSGMSSLEQVKDNVATFDEYKELSENDKELLKKASTLLVKSIGALCTSCRYCSDCPKGLDIPDLLSAYNEYKAGGDWRLKRLKVLPKEKRPEACTRCGLCVHHCPQNLDIPKYIEEMVEKIKEI